MLWEVRGNLNGKRIKAKVEADTKEDAAIRASSKGVQVESVAPLLTTPLPAPAPTVAAPPLTYATSGPPPPRFAPSRPQYAPLRYHTPQEPEKRVSGLGIEQGKSLEGSTTILKPDPNDPPGLVKGYFGGNLRWTEYVKSERTTRTHSVTVHGHFAVPGSHPK